MIEAVIFDFDGVILDSEKIKDDGFRHIFREFDKEAVDCLVAFHKDNGGLSRFVKIAYMFETILKRPITDDIVMRYADEFSKIMLSRLTNPDFLIKPTMRFIKALNGIPMHIASGTEENELRSLVKSLGISEYFVSVYGSPADKADNVRKIIAEGGYTAGRVVMIGDSMQDFKAADKNGLIFCGFNNEKLKDVSDYYITDFSVFCSNYGIDV